MMTRPNDALFNAAHNFLTEASAALQNANRALDGMVAPSELLVRFDVGPLLTQITLLRETLDNAQRDEYRRAT